MGNNKLPRIRLNELIDIGEVQTMVEAHYNATSIPNAIVDALDGEVLVAAGWQDICTKFHRVNPATLSRCTESDLAITGRLRNGEAARYKCRNGLWDIGIPIIVGGRHIATMFLGQFLYENEDTNASTFEKQADEFGFDKVAYLDAFSRVPVFSREKVEDIILYNRAFAQFLGRLAESALSQRKELEKSRMVKEAAKESEKRLALAMDLANLGSWELDLATHAFTFNDQFYALYGTTVVQEGGTEMLAETYAREFVHPEDSWVIASEMSKMLSPDWHDGSAKVEHRIIRRDGQIRHLDTCYMVVRDQTGQPVKAIGANQDITRRKLAEAALEKRMAALTLPLTDSTEIVFEDLFDIADIQRLQDQFAQATGVASIITKPDGTPITSPSNFCRLCSKIIRGSAKGLANCLKSDAAIGQPCKSGPTIKTCMSGGLWDAGAGISVGGRHVANWLIGQVRDETQTEESLKQYAREIDVNEDAMVQAFREVPAMSRDKFESVAQALFTLANQLSSFAYQNVQQARFISDRKQAEEALHEAERSYRDLVENAPIGIFRATAEGRYLMANARLAEIFGYDSPDELLSHVKDIGSQIYDEPSERPFPLDSLKQGGGKATRRRRKDGSIVWVVTSMRRVVDSSGNVMFYEGFTSDITDRVRMEEFMIQTEKMMSVGGLAAGMAHEINNPLGGILQNLQNIIRRISSDLSPNIVAADEVGCSIDSIRRYLESRGVVQFLELATDAGRRAANIVSNMLEFSRKTGSNWTEAEVNNLIEKSIELAATDYDLKKKYDFRKIKVVRDLAQSNPRIMCSQSEIEQVLFNLLKNAAQAIMTKRYPEGMVPIITVKTYESKDSVVLEVNDNGPGMEDSVRKHIFEPFYTTKAPGQGTGLGLSVSYFIVTENHRGTIEVSSSLGIGSHFTISLPKTPKVETKLPE